MFDFCRHILLMMVLSAFFFQFSSQSIFRKIFFGTTRYLKFCRWLLSVNVIIMQKLKWWYLISGFLTVSIIQPGFREVTYAKNVKEHNRCFRFHFNKVFQRNINVL